jgi:hypothetical protein
LAVILLFAHNFFVLLYISSLAQQFADCTPKRYILFPCGLSVAQGAMKDQLHSVSVALLDRYIRLLLRCGRICQTSIRRSSPYLGQPTHTYQASIHQSLLDDDCDLAMHLYTYDDFDRCTELQSSLDNSSAVAPDPLPDDMIILLDEDDEVPDTNISLLERRKICLPKRIRTATTASSSSTRVEQAPEQEIMDVEPDSTEGEIFQSMSCMLGLRNISLEVCALSFL